MSIGPNTSCWCWAYSSCLEGSLLTTLGSFVFQVRHMNERLRTLTGREEGFYAWVAANWLLWLQSAQKDPSTRNSIPEGPRKHHLRGSDPPRTSLPSPSGDGWGNWKSAGVVELGGAHEVEYEVHTCRFPTHFSECAVEAGEQEFISYQILQAAHLSDSCTKQGDKLEQQCFTLILR